MKYYKYDNNRDLLKFLLDVCKTNENVDWNETENKASEEFKDIKDIIFNHLYK